MLCDLREDTRRVLGLLLAPQRETFGEVLIAARGRSASGPPARREGALTSICGPSGVSRAGGRPGSKSTALWVAGTRWRPWPGTRRSLNRPTPLWRGEPGANPLWHTLRRAHSPYPWTLRRNCTLRRARPRGAVASWSSCTGMNVKPSADRQLSATLDNKLHDGPRYTSVLLLLRDG